MKKNNWILVGPVLITLGLILQLISFCMRVSEEKQTECITQYKQEIVNEGDTVVIDGKIYKLSAEEIK